MRLVTMLLVAAGPAASAQALSSGTHTLPSSTASDLYILMNGEMPFARTYDGAAWELTQAGAAAGFVVTGVSTVTIPADGAVFRLVHHNAMDITASAQASRLLVQATFGPRLAELSSVDASSTAGVRAWIHAQMALPLSSHRAYYRRRANPRLLAPLATGGVRSVCRSGSRWHRYALTKEDKSSTLTVAADVGSGGFTFHIGGELRTLASSFALGVGEWTVCYVEERVQGTLELRAGSGSTCKRFGSNGQLRVRNPPLAFASADLLVTHIVDESDPAALVPFEHAWNVSVLDGALDCSPHFSSLRHGFLRTPDGAYHRHDPRMALLDNTLEAPANASAFSGEGGASPPLQLPRVAKTFLNRHTCRPVALGTDGTGIAYGGALFTLNSSTLRSMYASAGSYVHAIDGLRLEAPYDISPCRGVSRWRRGSSGPCASEVVPDAATRQTIVAAISGSGDTNPHVIDVEMGTGTCSDATNGVSAVGARVSVGSTCWQHVHPAAFNVYDFSYFPGAHPGGAARITQFAEANSIYLSYPPSHDMFRWRQHRTSYVLLGRLDDVVDFQFLPQALQRPELAALVGATSIAASDAGFEACGSHGEITNDPTVGNLYNMFLTGVGDPPDGQPADVRTIPNVLSVSQSGRDYPDMVDTYNEKRTRGINYNLRQGKNIEWTMMALGAPDQLRQRVAWALAQIFVISDTSMKWNEVETWHVYYDIFVRHAFGSFRAVMQEVSYSPMMAKYLTFQDNKAISYDGSWPDENFAREIMQLFTIGLWELNGDGTQRLDAAGRPVMTYDNDDIVTLSRAWTGHALQPPRGNIENIDGGATGGRNYVDPMRLMPHWRDPFPKLDLHDTYIGDGYPLCVDLPSRAFLRRGAKYEYLGSTLSYHMWLSYDAAYLELSDGSSALHQALCNAESQGGACQLRSLVTLHDTLTCHHLECDSAPRLIKIISGNTTAYYEWHRPACVEFPFYADAKVVTLTRAGTRDHCADPRTPVAGSCCLTGSTVRGLCNFARERMTYATAASRCANVLSGSVCPSAGSAQRVGDECNWKSYYIRQWRQESCTLRAQVDASGWVAIVHEPYSGTASLWGGNRPSFAQNNQNAFRVVWDDSAPDPANGCSGTTGCTLVGATCMCDVDVETVRIFDSSPSGRAAVEAQSFIGSLCADSYGPSEYTLLHAGSEVEVYSQVSNPGGGGYNEDAILRVIATGRCYSNKQSHVIIRAGDTAGRGDFRFRNAPHFVSFLAPTALDAAHETEAVLDHYFNHPNTAPFIAHRLIQRFTTSNPSPGYVSRVATAFRTGASSATTYSGEYGDLGATMEALLLDPEARSITLDADPHHGVMREPLLKLHHFLRSMEFVSKDGREVEMPNIQGDIGMEAHKSPSVFNFYQADYQPNGPIVRSGSVAPEAGLATAPYIIGFINGMTALVRNGLSSCMYGFGRECPHWRLRAEVPQFEWSDGRLSFVPTAPDNAPSVVSQLNLLLTGGRLNANATAVITEAYTSRLASTSAASALELAQQLFVATPEFHASNVMEPTHAPRKVGGGTDGASTTGDFKAIVVLFMDGGCDSYNMLIPYCTTTASPAVDMYAHYESVRGDVRIERATLNPHQISTTSGTHPCNNFAVHPDLSFVREMYSQGDASFVANVGSLIEPIDRTTYFDGTRRLPPQVFAHNMGQKAAQNLHPQLGNSKGVLGRMLDQIALQQSARGISSYSIAGNAKMVEGETVAPVIISPDNGVVRLFSQDEPELPGLIAQVLAPSTSSIFGETIAELTEAALEGSERVGNALAQVRLSQSFEDNAIGKQLLQVATIINASDALQTERQVFFVKVGSFDTHSDNGPIMQGHMTDINNALRSFVAEVKTQGKWDDVALFSVSEFGRTITSNGAGTDHGWGGHHFLLGGSVNGGKIHGSYPADLSSSSPLNTGRGRIIPTMPWEAVWKPLAVRGWRSNSVP